MSYSYYFRGQQKRQEQTKKRGKRVSILGLWRPFVTFVYALVLGGFVSQEYIAMMDIQAKEAPQEYEKTGRIRVIVQDNGSIHKSNRMAK